MFALVDVSDAAGDAEFTVPCEDAVMLVFFPETEVTVVAVVRDVVPVAGGAVAAPPVEVAVPPVEVPGFVVVEVPGVVVVDVVLPARPTTTSPTTNPTTRSIPRTNSHIRPGVPVSTSFARTTWELTGSGRSLS